MKKVFGLILFVLTGQLSISQVLYKSPQDLVRGYTFTIHGNLNGPVDTKIQIEENDYVFIEAVGHIHVGDYLGDADPTGLLTEKLMFPRYFKYPGIRHGSLVIFTSTETLGCQRIFREMGIKYSNPFTPEYDPNVVQEGMLRDYIPGYYFISPGKSHLYFDINDTVVEDNSGVFTVKVYIIRYKDHLNRNYFNYCPGMEPESGSDIKLRQWNKEDATKSFYYHGVLNSSYRGGSFDNAGCQCVYGDFSKKLILNEGDQGSFDIAYWLFRGKTDQQSTINYYHLILDAIPHDLYVDKFGELPTLYHFFKNTKY